MTNWSHGWRTVADNSTETRILACRLLHKVLIYGTYDKAPNERTYTVGALEFVASHDGVPNESHYFARNMDLIGDGWVAEFRRGTLTIGGDYSAFEDAMLTLKLTGF